MEWFVRVLNRALSFVAFLTAATLVLYMLVVIVTGTYDVGKLMLDTILLEPDERQTIFNVLNGDFLHNVAILLIMMKAYRILVEYMRYHHIDLKYIVEVVVIACVLELLFNSSSYTPHMQIVLAAVATAFLALYVFKYETLKGAVTDTQQAFAKTFTRVVDTEAINEPEPTVLTEKVAVPKKRVVKKRVTTTRKATR